MKAWQSNYQRKLLIASINTRRPLKYVSLLVLLAFCFGCEPGESSAEKQLVEAYFTAAFAEDYSSLEAMLHDDFVFLGPKLADTLNKQDLINSWRSTHARNDTLLMQNPRIYDVSRQATLAEEQSLVLHYYDARFHNADLDRWVEFPVHVKFLIFQERIQQAQIIINQSDIQKQLGYTIIPPKY